MATFFDSLILKLGGDPSDLKKALDDADKQLGKFKSNADGVATAGGKVFGALGKSLSVVGKSLGLLVGLAGAAAGAVQLLATSSAKQADEAGKAAQKTGVQAAEYQKLAYAAKLADVEQDTLQQSLLQFSKTLITARDETSKEAAQFKILGIALKDARGQMRPTGDILKDLATVFAAAPDSVSKTALALDMFGKSGAELIPLLNQGGTEISRLGEEADKLGLVFSDSAIAQSERFNDSMTTLVAALEGVKNQIGQAFIPVLTQLVETSTKWLVENRALIISWVKDGWAYVIQVVNDLFALFAGNDKAVVNTWLITVRDGLIEVKDVAVAVLGVLQALIAPFAVIRDAAANVTAMLGGVSAEDRRAAGVQYARGGIVNGPGTGTSDSITARLSRGEGVVTARAVGHYGEGLVHAINSLRLPKFAEGGIVGATATATGRPVNVHFGGETFSMSGLDGEVARMMRAGRLQLASRPRWAGR
jgi:TP901 family phage tail tape measure protein